MRSGATIRTAAAFSAAYGQPCEGLWAAPGRINLIGEHTDYSGGFVLPMALPHRVVCAAAARRDGEVRVQSVQLPGAEVRIEVAALAPGTVRGWAAYPLGVIWALREAGYAISGVDLLLDGDLPHGAGLSSSAAVECAVAIAVDDLNDFGLDRTALALIGQRAENDFVGVPTGVMDQMVSMHARAGHALFLDARDLQFSSEPFDVAAVGLALLVIDTRTPHRLVEGGYGRRRRECESAAGHLGVDSLREVTPEVLASAAWSSMPRLLRRRARHVVTENSRVHDVVACLRRGDLAAIGPLLVASHASLRDDFEVSVGQLDVAVHAALSAGAHGARMTGAGFGGSVIALVDAPDRAEVTATVRSAFAARGFPPVRVFAAVPSGAAERIG